jgi:transposase-like protein
VNVEDLTQADADDVQPGLPSDESPTTSRRVGRRSRLTQDQQRELARLYAETTASTAEIRQRFGVGESSLYRVLQKQGVPLRGRTVHTAGSKNVRIERDGLAQPAARKRMSTSRTESSALRARTPRNDVRNSNRGAAQFRIEFRAVRVYEAADIRDALRQAEASEMADILEIVRAS